MEERAYERWQEWGTVSTDCDSESCMTWEQAARLRVAYHMTEWIPVLEQQTAPHV